jgi:DNA transformation protein
MKMAVNEALLDYVKSVLSRLEGFRIRKMFGGAGLFIDGTIFGIVYETEVYLKTNDEIEGVFIEKGMGRFNPFPGRGGKMPYFEVPPDVLEDEKGFLEWSRRSYRTFK